MSSSFDPLGDTLGGLSVFAQGLGACIRGFDLWQKGQAIDEDATIFKVKLDLQAAKIEAWSCGWGIDKNQHVHHPKFRQYSELASNCINLIAYQAASLEALDEEFPILKAAVPQPRGGISFEFLSRLSSPQLRHDVESFKAPETIASVASIEGRATFQEKWKWGWQDGKALRKLEILESLIDNLYQILPPPKDDPLAALVFNSSLASSNTKILDALGSQAVDNPLETTIAWLKSTILKLERRSTILQDKQVHKLWNQVSDIRKNDTRNSRAVATYQGSDILVEWKTVVSSRSHHDYLVLDRRIKDVARVLQTDFKPEELRTLPCIGVTERIDEEEIQYSLLYSLPSPSTYFSLSEWIFGTKNRPLGDYFTIAKALSKALLFWHLAGWLHKGFRSHNILFFAKNVTAVLPEYPYIVGFEYSRADVQDSLTEDLADDREFNLYRHPDSQGHPMTAIEEQDESIPRVPPPKNQYRREYDIYSLGVVLLEIGLRKTVQQIFSSASANPVYNKHSPERFRAWLTDAIAPQLGTKMGVSYLEATLSCLRGNFDTTEKTLEAAFYVDVIQKLEACRV
jgi:hypothetical protein